MRIFHENNQMLIRTFPVTNRIVIKVKPKIKLAISKSFYSFSLRGKDPIYDQRLKKSRKEWRKKLRKKIVHKFCMAPIGLRR